MNFENWIPIIYKIENQQQQKKKAFSSSSSETPKLIIHPNPARTRIYGIACQVKYLVDSLENIWGCLDESMFVESATQYVRAKHMHHTLTSTSSSSSSFNDLSVLSNFPLLHHQWQIIESFKVQILQRSCERLLERELLISAYADVLAGVTVIDEMHPNQVLPVDHPIISSFDSVLNFSQGLENASFDAFKPLEMDSGELSFNAFVKDINEIGMRLVAEKVRKTEIRKLESNFV